MWLLRIALSLAGMVLVISDINVTLAQGLYFDGHTTVEDVRSLVVVPDSYPYEIGNLNRTIENELEADPETVFILQRDAVYWLDETIEVSGNLNLHIRAEEGEGHPPIIRSAVAMGTSRYLFFTQSDVIFNGVFITAIDEAGKIRRPLVHRGSNNTIVFENGWIVGTRNFSVWIKEEGNSVFMTNSIFANAGSDNQRKFGSLLNTGGFNQDTIWVENTTLYNFHYGYLRNSGLIDYLYVNHNTALNVATNILISRALTAEIKNNLFLNFYTHGIPEGSPSGIIAAERLDWLTNEISDDERTIIIKNNNIGHLDDEHKEAMIASRESRRGHDGGEAPVLDKLLQEWVNSGNGPSVIFDNNFAEEVNFANPPEAIVLWSTNLIENRPYLETVYDQWDEASENLEPAPYHYTEEFIRNFSYSLNHASFSSAENGYPVGDLNWFPELKDQWEQGVTAPPVPTRTENSEKAVKRFHLVGNYPNPFNPGTTVVYEVMSDTEVTLEMFNVLGQNVKFLDLGKQSPGRHQVMIYAGELASGVYMLRMQSGNEVQTLRISLVR